MKTLLLYLHHKHHQPNLLKRIGIVLCSLLFVSGLHAQIITSTTTGGNWNATGTWVGGVVPTSTKSVVINGPVTVNVSASAIDVTINAGKSLFMSGTNTLSTSGNLSVAGTLSVGAATGAIAVAGNTTITGSLALGAGNFTCNGTTTVASGSLTDANNTGNDTYVGLLSIASGATYSCANNSPVEFRAGVSNLGSFSKAGSGNVTFTNSATFASNSAVTIAGAVSINGATTFSTSALLSFSGSLAVNANTTITSGSLVSITGSTTLAAGIIVTNNGTATLTGVLNGTDANSKWINANGAILNYSNAAIPFASAGSLDASAISNTVTYNGTTQAILGTNYGTLNFTGTGTKTINGNPISIAGALTVGTGSVLTITSGNFSANSTTSISGTITDNSASGIDVFSNLVTINVGATLSSTAATAHSFEFHNGIIAHGTLNLASISTSTFKTNNQSITGSSTATSLGIVVIDADIQLTNGIIASNGLIIKGNLDGLNNGSTFTNAANAVLSYQGAASPMVTAGAFSVSAGGSTVNYSGSTQNVYSTTYHHIGFTATGVKTIANITVNGNFNYTNGTLSISGVQTFSGAVVASMSNTSSPTFIEIIVNKPGSSLTLTGSGFSTSSLTVSSGTLAFGASTARTISVNQELAGTGTIDMSLATHTLNLGGENNVIGTLITDANNSSVNYTRNGNQTIFSTNNYKNLVLSGAGIKTISGLVRVQTALNMTSVGNYFLSLGNNDLKMSPASTLSGTFSSNRYIITDGTGVIVKEGTTTAQLRTSMNTNGLFPIGAGGFYTPYQINALTGTITGTATISVRAVASRQPNVPYFNNALTKFWEVETSNISISSANAQYSFNSAEVIGSVAGYVPRVWDGTNLSAGSAGSTPSTPGSNPFFVNNNTFLAGSWTAIDPTVRAALYSYQSGDWNNANTWTTDPSGNTLVSPMVPGAGDQVVILNGRTVTTTIARTVGSMTINDGGVLDLGTSTGHTFGPIAGEGRMRLSTTNLPTGNYLTFCAIGGGTIEYYNIGASALTLSTSQTTYNNLEINNSTSIATSCVLNSNLTVNGNFSMTKSGTGANTFTIGAAASALNLTFNKNITISAGSIWNVGAFNATHNIVVIGNLSTSGTIDFTNDADYATQSTGAANIHFQGLNTNTTLTCNAGSTTSFYGFQSTKGTGYELSVTAASSASVNFVNNGNTFQANNNGILRFGSNITIPRMIGNGGGNYDLGSTSSLPVLWIDGATITYNANSAIVPYGTLKITSGSFTCLTGQGGIVIRESGLILIQGGTVNAKMIRTSVTAATHRGTYIQTGGILNVSGDNGAEQGYYSVFSLPYNENVFKMSGGTINITRANTVGSFCPNGGIMIGSLPQNIDVTGGTVNIKIAGNVGFDISSRAPFWDLNISKTAAGTGAVRIAPITWTYSGNASNQVTLPAYPLSVLGNLTIVNGTNSGALNANGYDVVCSGDFNIQASTTYTTGSNTTRFNGTNNQTFTISGSVGTGINHLAIDKSGTTLTIAGTASSLISLGNLNLNSGTLNDNGKTLSFKGNIINSGTHIGTGKIQLNGSTAAQIISGNGSGVFANLELINTFGTAGSVQVSLTDAISINGTLNLANDRLFNIANNQLSLSTSASITASPGSFSSNRFIKTAGFLSDGGLKKEFSASFTSFVYPFGTGTNYTPATISFPTAPSTWGTIDVRPVTARQLYVTSSDCFSYYWKVNQNGFTGIPANSINLSFNYGNLSDNTNYIPGYYNFQTISYTTINDVNAVNEGTNVISFNNFSKLEGDYTAGNISAFGIVVPYYSRANGNWNVASTWSNSAFGGTASSTIPNANVPVFIGDGNTYNHDVTVTSNGTVSGSLLIGAGSLLNLGSTTGNNFGALPYSTAGGAGKIRISSSAATAEFPAGDFGLFFMQNGGTTEYYTNTSNFTIPSVTAAPTSMTIQSYKNLIVSPAASNSITLPNSDLDVYQHLTINGASTTSDALLPNSTSRIINVLGNLNVTGGRFRFGNTSAQTINVTGNIAVSPGATIDVSTSGSALHTINLYGNITNDGTIDLNAASDVTLNMIGSSNSTINGSNAAALTDIYKLNINKGNNQSLVVDATLLGALAGSTDNWLVLSNGTFRYSKASSITLTSGTDVNFSIPSTSKLSINNASAIVNIGQNNSGGADLILGGTLELIDGTVNIGSAAYSSHNDIEYTPTDAPSIILQNNASLNVNGQIRRSVYALQGSLSYSQSGNSTTLIRGKNPDGTGSFNLDRAKFEILNEGSNFSMSDNSLLIIDRNGNASNMFGDVYLTPATFSITGGEVRIGTGNTNSNMQFNCISTTPFWNLTVDGTVTSKIFNNQTNPTTVLNNFTIDGNSIYKANGLDVTVGGHFTNENNNASTGIAVGGYQTGTANQTTFLNGSSGSQTITGIAGNITNFANLVINNSWPTGAISLAASSSNVRVNGTLNLNNGGLNILDNTITAIGDVTSNVATTTTSGYFVMGGTASQSISGNGLASFQNFKMSNAAGVELTSNLSINGMLNFNTGLLYINNYLLTLGESASISGTLNTNNMIRVNGVISDAGVKKLYPATPYSFTFPVGTTLKYTPSTINVTSNSVAGAITLMPVNVKHPATTDPLNKELTYYWNVTSTGFSPTITANHIYNYHPNDAVNGDETVYKGGHYFSNQWVPANGIAGAVNDATDRITLTGVNYIDGDYTAGEATEFGNIQIYFSRNATLGGNWSDVNSWSTDVVLQHAGAPCASAPTSNNIVIAAGHTITCQPSDVNKQSPVAIINGTLNLNSTSGHNFGYVSGTGVIRLTPNGVGQFIFPGGDYSIFTSNIGGAFEYSSNATSNLPLQSTYNHIIFSGSGTKNLANTNLLINGDFTVSGGNVTNVYNKNISLFGSWNNQIGIAGFIQGTGVLLLNGTNQNLSGATNFYHVNVAGAGTKTLNSSIYISNTLTLNQGIIATGNNEVSLSAVSSVVGGSINSYINGNMRKYLPAGTLNAVFEIGDANNYTPAEITFQGSIANSSNILARTDASDHSNIYPSGINELKSCNRTWTLIPTALTGYTSISAKLNFVSSDIDASANPMLFTGARYNASTWTLATSATSQLTYTQLSNLSGLGVFQIGEAVNGIIWTGATNSNWNLATNWQPNVVPTINDDVIVGPVTNQPLISTGNNGLAKNLSLYSGSTISIANGKQLQVHGNISSTNATVTGQGTLAIHAANGLQTGNLLVGSNMSIINGSMYTLSSGSNLELQRNLDVLGQLSTNNEMVSFTGLQSSIIGGNSDVNFHHITINKADPTLAVILNEGIVVSGNIQLVNGDLDGRDEEIDLGTTGAIVGESSNNRVITASGTIVAQRLLNAPSAENVAGLGVELTSTENLGLTTIIRGNQQKVYNAGFGMNRYYEIHPANNADLNATLKFNYFDDELSTSLGTIAEAEIDLWRFDGVNWNAQFATLDANNNQLIKTNIPQFSIWTAGSRDNNALPISLVSFNGDCNSSTIDLKWTTASESNNKMFFIEESQDAKNWVTIRTVSGSGNSNTNKNYAETVSSNFSAGSYFRLTQVDFNGNSKSFDPIFVNCEQSFSNEVSIMPNPVVDMANVTIGSSVEMDVNMTLFSSAGQILFAQKIKVNKGSNSIRLDMSALPSGAYHLNITNNKKIELTGNRSIIKR